MVLRPRYDTENMEKDNDTHFRVEMGYYMLISLYETEYDSNSSEVRRSSTDLI